MFSSLWELQISLLWVLEVFLLEQPLVTLLVILFNVFLQTRGINEETVAYLEEELLSLCLLQYIHRFF